MVYPSYILNVYSLGKPLNYMENEQLNQKLEELTKAIKQINSSLIKIMITAVIFIIYFVTAVCIMVHTISK